MDEGPLITWRIAVGLIGAGIVTFALGVGGWVWFAADVVPILQDKGLAILIIPGTVIFVMLLGVVWFRVFSLILTVLRSEEFDP